MSFLTLLLTLHIIAWHPSIYTMPPSSASSLSRVAQGEKPSATTERAFLSHKQKKRILYDSFDETLGRSQTTLVQAKPPKKIHTVEILPGDTSLPASALNQTLLTLLINSNHKTGFTLRVHFANGGLLKLVQGVSHNASSSNSLALHNIRLVPTGGTLGTPLSPPSTTPYSLVLDTLYGGRSLIWRATAQGPNHATPTVNYQVELRADWSAAATCLAGQYQELVSVTIALDD